MTINYFRSFTQVMGIITAMKLKTWVVILWWHLASGCLSVLVLLYLSAAFETVDHSILLKRLWDVIGIKDQVLNSFRSYLSDRFQFVHVHNCFSERKTVSHGVSQGSVLWPLHFNIYKLPLGNTVSLTKPYNGFNCYADDAKLYLTIKPGG